MAPWMHTMLVGLLSLALLIFPVVLANRADLSNEDLNETGV